MKSIAFFNNKGGVGKTTLLCNLAGFLAVEKKKRVLIIDADPQSNATAYLLPDDQLSSIYEGDEHVSLYEYYESVARGKGYSEKLPSIAQSPRFHVDLVPGHPKFALREDLLAKDWGDTQIGDDRGLQTTYTFQYLLDQLEENYELIFIDMGPSLGAINRSILLAADYFITPMSADLFSLMAIDNIILSLKTWQADLQAGLDTFQRKSQSAYMVNSHVAKWKVRFLGYVTQQYKQAIIKGESRAVKSYDKIIQRFPAEINRLEAQYGLNNQISADLGQFPSLYSLVPMSQTAHAPIFSLASSDGIVGAHFAKVDESKAMFNNIADRLLCRLETFEAEA